MILPLVRPPLRVLVIVKRDQVDMVGSLAARFHRAAVLVDRRQAERRRQPGVRPALERRSGQDRRRALYEPEELLWREAGYRIVYRANGVGPGLGG